MSKTYSARHYAIFGCALCFAAAPLLAQDAVRSAPAPAPAGQPEEVVVEGVPPDQSILPTARPISSIYGTDQDIVDIPRDVSTITKEQVDERQITSVDDLGQFASGTYTASIFGAEGVPQIRGVPAEIYQNGEREHYYFNSFPPSFNGTESIDVVKGPGTAVYGPAAQGLGGYVNLVTKQPFFDGQHTEITTIIGDLYGGGDSYGRYQWQIDNSGPLIKDQLAYRFSYLGREASGYYRNISDNVEDIFGAVTYTPTTKLTINATSQFYESKFNENAGFNRITQDLIDNHTYISGPFFLQSPFGQVPPPPFEGYVEPLENGNYNSQKVTLHNDQVLVAAGDSAAGSRSISQVIATLQLDGLTIKNSSFGDYVDSRKFSAYGYDEYAPSNIAIENRTEFQFELKTPITAGKDVPPVKDKDGKDAKDAKEDKDAPTHEDGLYIDNHFDTGFSFRYEHTRAYSAFTNEPFSVYDISGTGPHPQQFPTAVIFGPERTIPEMPGYYASNGFGLEEALDSDYLQGGLFLQDMADFTKYFTGIFGVRADIIAAYSGAPNLGPVVDPSQGDTSLGDPALPLAATDRIPTTIVNGSYFGSLTFKPIKPLGIYLTYDRVDGTDAQDNQGALAFDRVPGTNETRVPRSDLTQMSELYEGGFKASLLHDTLYLGAAGYHQSRFTTDERGNVSAIVARGADVDMTYEPNKAFSVTTNFTWQAANYKHGQPYAQTGSYLDTFAPGVPVNGNEVGTGVGSPNYESLKPGNYRLADVPNILYNAYFIYNTPWGVTIGIGPQVTGDVLVNNTGEVDTGKGGPKVVIPSSAALTIPAQVTWNGFVAYKWKNYEARLSFFNILDAQNWTPPANGFANNDLLYPDEPFHMNMTLKMKF